MTTHSWLKLGPTLAEAAQTGIETDALYDLRSSLMAAISEAHTANLPQMATHLNEYLQAVDNEIDRRLAQ